MRFMKILINNFLELITLVVKIAVIISIFMAFVVFGVYLMKCYGAIVGILIWLLSTIFILAVIISSEEFKEGK